MTIGAIILSIVLIVAITYITSICFKEDKTYRLLEELENAEFRAVTHFRKLHKIEMILRKAESEKTPSVIVLEQIKEVIVGQNK